MTTRDEREEDRAVAIEHRLTRIEIWLAVLTVIYGTSLIPILMTR